MIWKNIHCTKTTFWKNTKKRPPADPPHFRSFISTPLLYGIFKKGSKTESRKESTKGSENGSSAPFRQAKSAKKIFSQLFTVYAGMSAAVFWVPTAGKFAMRELKVLCKSKIRFSTFLCTLFSRVFGPLKMTFFWVPWKFMTHFWP